MNQEQKGVSFVEIILVVAILGILAVSSFSFSSTLIARNDHKNVVNELVSSLRTAQISAMSGKEDGQWGVNVSMAQREIVMFQGDNYLSRNPDFDQVFEISGSVSVTEGEIVFEKNTGNPPSSTSFTVSSNVSDANTVSVNEIGIVDVN